MIRSLVYFVCVCCCLFFVSKPFVLGATTVVKQGTQNLVPNFWSNVFSLPSTLDGEVTRLYLEIYSPISSLLTSTRVQFLISNQTVAPWNHTNGASLEHLFGSNIDLSSNSIVKNTAFKSITTSNLGANITRWYGRLKTNIPFYNGFRMQINSSLPLTIKYSVEYFYRNAINITSPKRVYLIKQVYNQSTIVLRGSDKLQLHHCWQTFQLDKCFPINPSLNTSFSLYQDKELEWKSIDFLDFYTKQNSRRDNQMVVSMPTNSNMCTFQGYHEFSPRMITGSKNLTFVWNNAPKTVSQSITCGFYSLENI